MSTSGNSALFKHGVTYLWARALPSLVNVAALAIYTRFATPEEYGVYASIVASVTIANSLFFQWLRLSVLRLYSAHHDKRHFLSVSTSIYLLSVLLVVGLAALVALFTTSDIRPLLMFGTLLLVVTSWFELTLDVLRATLRPSMFGVSSTVRSLSALLISTVLLLLGWGMWALLVGLAVSYLAASAVVFREAWPRAGLAVPQRALALSLFRYGFPLSLSLTFATAIRSSDKVMLSALSTPEEAGFYAAGYSVAQTAIETIMLAVSSAGYPLAVNALEAEGQEAARSQVRSNTRLLIAFSLPATVGVSLVARDLAPLLLGEEFVVAASLLIPIIAVSILFSGLRANYIDHAFHLGRSTWHLTLLLGVAAGVNLAGNVLLIPRFGGLGAATSTLGSYLVAFLIAIPMSRRAFPLPGPGRDAALSLLASVIMAIPLLFWPADGSVTTLLLKVMVGAALYFASLYAMNGFGSRKWLHAKLAAGGSARR